MTHPIRHPTSHTHRTPIAEPVESEGEPMPIEPLDVPSPAVIPEDPEHDRVIDPAD